MSLAEKCDMCGQFTEPYIRRSKDMKSVKIRCISTSDYDIDNAERDNFRYYNICENCHKAFEEFVKNAKHEPPKEEITDEDLSKYML